MNNESFTTTITVDATAADAFRAINNVRGWWSQDIEGSTDKLNEVFTYHYEDEHYCKIKVVEVIPNEQVVWLVLDNHFNFTRDQNEWTGTKISFEITELDNKTQIRFTHLGLVPEYECNDVCRDAWSKYIKNSLQSLITTGKGQPNPIGGRNAYQDELSGKMNQQDYHAVLMVNTTANEAFEAINHVSSWWTENLDGSSEALNDEFTVRFGNVHVSTQKLVELIPDQKVVWLVTNSNLNFIDDKQEWTNTRIIFELSSQDDKTRIDFTHAGLNPGLECFQSCTKGWDHYIKGSLLKLLMNGKGTPGPAIKTLVTANNI